jgi:hypothetical protein
MSKTLKLSPKQLAAIQGIEAQKQQLDVMQKDASAKQNLVVELAFEAAGIDVAGVGSVKLEGDSLIYEEKEEPVKTKAGTKKKAAVPVG